MPMESRAYVTTLNFLVVRKPIKSQNSVFRTLFMLSSSDLKSYSYDARYTNLFKKIRLKFHTSVTCYRETSSKLNGNEVNKHKKF
jgi:hypothetical protein